jgi:hypothetical protein
MKVVFLNFSSLFSGVINTSKALKKECKINPQLASNIKRINLVNGE